MADKPHMNLVVTGHVDHGKSTAMGHFLYDLGVVEERIIKPVSYTHLTLPTKA